MNINNISELSVHENGGEPNRDTSLEYDVTWATGRTLRGIWDGIVDTSKKAARRDSVVLG